MTKFLCVEKAFEHLRPMAWRFCLVFPAIFLFTPSGIASAQKVRTSIVMSNASVDAVLNRIEKNSDYVFLYNDDTIQTNRIVSVNNTSRNIVDILDEVFKGTNVSYTFVDKQIILSTRQETTDDDVKAPITANGVVTDASGEPLVGVGILIKGTTTGTTTDFEGRYSLKAYKGAVLEISYLGFVTQELTVNNERVQNVALEEDSKMLDEVVVTALGIKRETKSLTYNVQQLDGSIANTTNDMNVMSGLAGKVAGVSINASASGIGGSTRVVMRGTKSISGNNNALYVIDGVPLANAGSDQPDDQYTGAGQSGDGLASINAEDIESISVLNGSAAAALYGSSAANGVILITTKKGTAGKTQVNYSNNTTFYSPFKLPEFQNTYGSDTGAWYSWASKLSTPSSYSVRDFFQTGYNEANTVSLTTGNEKNQTYVSVGSVNARGIIQNNEVDRYNVSFRNTTSLLKDRLTLDLSFMYSNVTEQNMLSQGEYANPLVAVYLFPRGDDFDKYKYYERYDVDRNIMTQYWPLGDNGLSMQNPYWVTNRNMYINKKDRFLVSASATYKIFDWLNVSGRVKMDKESIVSEKKMYASTLTVLAENSDKGAYIEKNKTTTQWYADIMLNINKYFGHDNWNVTSTIGASLLDFQYHELDFGGGLLTIPNLFTVNNVDVSGKLTYENTDYHDRTNSIFGTASLGYKGMVYLDASLRNDWMSALAGTGTTSIIYPSVGMSAIITSMFNRKSDIINYAKVRVSYSEVGNAPERYAAITTYSVLGGLTTTSYFPATDLEPERTHSWEVGTDLAFLNDKFKLSATLYKSYTENQLFSPSISTTTGYSSIYVNAGKVTNKGIELTFNVDQKLGPVQWFSTVIYTLNRNRIDQLLPSYTNDELGVTVSLDELDVYSLGGVKQTLTVGGSMGDIYVNTMRTDSDGYIWMNSMTGALATDKTNYVYAGNTNPKYTMSWRNEFSWKGLNLSFLINARVGGVGVSATQAVLDYYGVSQVTADARDAGGVLVNGQLVDAQTWYQTVGANGTGFIGSQYVYSLTNVRLGEVTLGYDVPIEKLFHFVKDLRVSLVGKNLLMLYCKAPFDPESTASTDTYNQGIDYFMQPSLKSVGFSVKASF